jgi:hypothetical protein
MQTAGRLHLDSRIRELIVVIQNNGDKGMSWWIRHVHRLDKLLMTQPQCARVDRGIYKKLPHLQAITPSAVLISFFVRVTNTLDLQ